MVTLPLLMVNIAVVSGFSSNFCLWLNPDFVGEIRLLLAKSQVLLVTSPYVSW